MKLRDDNRLIVGFSSRILIVPESLLLGGGGKQSLLRSPIFPTVSTAGISVSIRKLRSA
jgi:hypothetical protein